MVDATKTERQLYLALARAATAEVALAEARQEVEQQERFKHRANQRARRLYLVALDACRRLGDDEAQDLRVRLNANWGWYVSEENECEGHCDRPSLS